MSSASESQMAGIGSDKLLSDADLSFLIELDDLASKWKTIGIYLGIPSSRLNIIQENNRGGVDMCGDCLRDIFIWWLRNGEDVTARRLAKAVHDVGEHRSEMKINKKFCISQDPCPPYRIVPKFDLPDYVQNYCSDVKTRYIQQSVLPDSDWPPSLGRQYIKLALIYQERQLKNHTYESVLEHQIDYTRGDYDKIMKYKTRIELINAFEQIVCEGGKEIVLKMLIDGAPGVGKTTLSRKVSSMWANGEILQRYWLVLLLHLREKAISNAKTIDEFFYHDDLDLKQKVIRFVKERSGDGVLIIFDGFDELSSYERCNESLFLDISKGKVLPKCAVTITSRPYASRSLQELPIINRHVEVLGFTNKQVQACIHEKIKDENRAKALCTELNDRLDVASICQIPLNCSIVLYVYEQEKYQLPRTLTELYELFILHSLKRFLKRTISDEDADALQALDELPSPSDNHFSALCGLAFEGLKSDYLVFSKKQVQAIFSSQLHAHLPLLDLMTSAKSYSSRGAQNTYSFLHLTIQEFLAAYWIAYHMLDSDKLNFFMQNLTANRFRMVLLFLSGLTKLTFPDVTSVFNSRAWKNDKVHICHLIYESGNHSLCKHISENYCGSLSGLNIELIGKSKFDKLVQSNFVAHSGCQWKKIEFVADDIEIFHKLFMSVRLPSSLSIEVVSVTFYSIVSNDLALLSMLDELQQVERVTAVVVLSGKTNIPTQHSDKSLINSLSEVFTGPQAIYNKDYSIHLKRCGGIRWCETMHSSKIVALFCKTLAECLVKTACMKKVILNHVFPTDIKNIFTTLANKESVSQLECLVCTKGFVSFGKKRRETLLVPFNEFCETLATIISHITSLKELDLQMFSGAEIDEIGICAIKCALQHNSTLQKLTLVPQQLLFERNIETGEMDLKCTQNYKEKLSAISASIIPCESDKNEETESLSLNLDTPPAKRPCTDSSPQGTSESDIAFAQAESCQPEMSILNTSTQSQALRRSPVTLHSLVGPSEVLHSVSTTTRMGHQFTSRFSHVRPQPHQEDVNMLPASSHYQPRQFINLECSSAGPLHASHSGCPPLIPHNSSTTPTTNDTSPHHHQARPQPQILSQYPAKSAGVSDLSNTPSVYSSSHVGCTQVSQCIQTLIQPRPEYCAQLCIQTVSQLTDSRSAQQEQSPRFPQHRASQAYINAIYPQAALLPVQSLVPSPQQQGQRPTVLCVCPHTSIPMNYPQPIQQQLLDWMLPHH